MFESRTYEAPGVTRRTPVDPALIGAPSSAPGGSLISAAFSPAADSGAPVSPVAPEVGAVPYVAPQVSDRVAVGQVLNGLTASDPAPGVPPSAVFAPSQGSSGRADAAGYTAPTVIRRSKVGRMLNLITVSSPGPAAPTDSTN